MATDLKKIIGKNLLLRRSYVSDDTKKALDSFAGYCKAGSKDYSFVSGTEYNGWQVPQKWSVQKALIKKDGKTIYDGMAHPLGVITNSDSFQGKVSKQELLKHLYSVPHRPHDIPFHFRLSYRPWDTDWGFCLPHDIVESMSGSTYEVDLQTTLEDGEMICREFTLEGTSKDTMIMVAHIDHPGQANDDLAGCAVGVEVLNRLLKQKKKPCYTYKLLLCPEIVGSVFYLQALGQAHRKNIKHALYLEMLGNENEFNLQASLTGDAYIDQVCQLALKKFTGKHKLSPFRTSAGNDEIVFEAPGIEIPMPSISRWPYDQYHTDKDNLDLINEAKLQEAVDYVLQVSHILETDHIVKRQFDGLISLANPKYDLYIDPGQIFTGGLDIENPQVLFQYHMPRYLNGEYSIVELASRFHLDYDWLLDYFQKMKQKQLITMSPRKD